MFASLVRALGVCGSAAAMGAAGTAAAGTVYGPSGPNRDQWVIVCDSGSAYHFGAHNLGSGAPTTGGRAAAPPKLYDMIKSKRMAVSYFCPGDRKADAVTPLDAAETARNRGASLEAVLEGTAPGSPRRR
jgi:hypothetical protein